jgi:excisionase family DNA binding protein
MLDLEEGRDRAPEPLAVTVEQARKYVPLPRTKYFQDIADGKLGALKAGKNTLIVMSELKRWLKTMPHRGRLPADDEPELVDIIRRVVVELVRAEAIDIGKLLDAEGLPARKPEAAPAEAIP